MLYLSPPTTAAVRSLQIGGALGCIATPAQRMRLPVGSTWCADNGCGPGADGQAGAGYPGDAAYLRMLASLLEQEGADPCDPDQSGCLFAVAPDVLGDAAATLRRSEHMLGWIRHLGYPAALVAQDGLERLEVPWDDFDALFLGGSTGWKLGPAARQLAAEAGRRGKWVHMGRVNSQRRLEYAAAIGCDSADGTYLAYGPATNLPNVLGWLRKVNGQAALFAA